MRFERDLVKQSLARTLGDDRRRVALLGLTPAAMAVWDSLERAQLGERILGIFDPGRGEAQGPRARPWSHLRSSKPDLLVVCADAEKEHLLQAYRQLTGDPIPAPDVVLSGTAHMKYRDPLFDELDVPAMVPSYATGHPHTRIHLFQFLQAAAAAGLDGAIVELGAFTGGTTAWLARVAARVGLRTQVLGFDSWAGFPPRRSVLDLYEHPRCVFTDVAAVNAYVKPLGVELIEGDIAETAPKRLHAVPVLLAFVDTDNFSATRVALETILPNLVAGGAVVLDHYWTSDQYLYTIGERMAAREVIGLAGLLQVHGTGVFVKLR